MKEISGFRKALKVLARSMNEPYEYTNPDGTVEQRNKLGFIQGRIMGGVCYQIIRAMEYTQTTTLPKAGDRLAEAHDKNKNDELSLLAIEKAQEWIEKLGEQLFEQETMLSDALAEYDAATGKDYYAGLPRAPKPVVNSERQAAAQAVLLRFARKPEAKVLEVVA